MKTKILLLFTALIFSEGIKAQTIPYQPLVRTANVCNDGQTNLLSGKERPLSRFRGNGRAGKGTISGRRVYNYVDHLAINNADVRSSEDYVTLPYMWFRPDIFAMYNIPAGQSRDIIRLSSYGMVFQPYWPAFNDASLYPDGTLSINQNNKYTIDSVIAYGVYRRNKDKHSVVDTLRFSYTYGFRGNSNVVAYGYTDTIAARYGTDTLFTAVLAYDSAKHTIKKPAISTGPLILYSDIYLHEEDTSREAFFITPSITVPAGNLFAVSVTFRSGETYTPFADTAFVSPTINPDNPYKFGMFRPAIYKEHVAAFPTYTKYNYNSGQFLLLPQATTPDEYTPTWLWTSNIGSALAPSNYQFPDIDFVVSCDTCWQLGVNDIPFVVIGDPFPNPSNENITVPLNMKNTADITVSISDITGRQLAVVHPGLLAANSSKNLTFNTKEWSNGIYFASVAANGTKVAKKFVISR